MKNLRQMNDLNHEDTVKIHVRKKPEPIPTPTAWPKKMGTTHTHTAQLIKNPEAMLIVASIADSSLLCFIVSMLGVMVHEEAQVTDCVSDVELPTVRVHPFTCHTCI